MNAKAHCDTPRHPRQSRSHLSYWRATVVALLASLAALAGVMPASGEAQEKKKRPPELVITGTVFTESGFSLPGATIRVNRAGERKTRGEAVSDRRGEFGVRVPPGAEYEVQVKAKGFEEQTQKVDGKSSLYENLDFRMKPVAGGKKP